MKIYIQKLLFLTTFLITLLFFIPSYTLAFKPLKDVCQSNSAKSSPICQQAQNQGDVDPVSGPGGLINTAASIVALITGIAAVVMIIIGGFMYITSGGNAERAAAGRRRIIYSLIALVIVALAWAVTTLIASRLIQ
jgi:uncharacterized membrane protein YhaH (DUF805 family)